MLHPSSAAPVLLLPILDFASDLYGQSMSVNARGLYVSLQIWTWHAAERGIPLDLADWAGVLNLDLEECRECWRIVRPLFEVRDGQVHAPLVDAQRRRLHAFQHTQSERAKMRWRKHG